MGKKKISPAAKGFLIIAILLIACWIIYQITPKREFELTEVPKKSKAQTTSINWREVANNIIQDYQGKVTEIRQLNSTTCWAVLSSNLSMLEAVENAENIGEYVKNVAGKKPSIHVFLNGKHVAVARSNLNGFYSGKIDIKDWMAWDEWK